SVPSSIGGCKRQVFDRYAARGQAEQREADAAWPGWRRAVAQDRESQSVATTSAQDPVRQHEGVLRTDIVDVLAEVPAVEEDLHSVGARRIVGQRQPD